MTKTDNLVEKHLPLPPAIFHMLLALSNGERHGYALKREILRRTKGNLNLGAGALYGSIGRMLERGFITVLENGDLELVNAQSGGRGEVLTGHIESSDSTIRLHFVSKALMNDSRMVSTARRFELEGDRLRYEMEMSTTKVTDLTRHLAITLERVRE